MNDGAVERYLLAFNDALVAGGERRERILAEVEEHLRDATESIIATGATAAEAQLEAVRRFGEPPEAAERFGSDPLGRAQQAARWYDSQRIAHPTVTALLATSPWIALSVWSGLTTMPLFAASMLWLHIVSNHRARRATASGTRPQPVWSSLTFAFDSRHVAATVLGIVALVVLVLPRTTTWYQLIFFTYVACGAAVCCSRLSWCENPACRRCGPRWAVRHPSAAAGVRYAAWVLALAGPGLAAMLPVTAGHAGTALFHLTIFVALAALPTRRSRQWLHWRRPAAQVALRMTPVLALLTVYAVIEPSRWAWAVGAAVALVVLAAQLETRRSRARSDATRRHLVDRIHGNSGGFDASMTEA
ncbi:MAG: hypothetical protein H0W96_02370 [Solirubrobacterales bacterium]|nr:hypothetical protein [Solirubrobacterales bacterium]